MSKLDEIVSLNMSHSIGVASEALRGIAHDATLAARDVEDPAALRAILRDIAAHAQRTHERVETAWSNRFEDRRLVQGAEVAP